MSVAPVVRESHPVQGTCLVAVIGNPNCGKTTLFNAMTGLRQKVGNYPGVTVEKREGVVTAEPWLHLLDLPGTYSLSARSIDEQIARDVLLGRRPDTLLPAAALVVIDATNLERNLYLATQVIDLGIPVVIACNVMDLLEKAGHRLDLEKLSDRLSVPVIRTVASRGEGVGELITALRQVCTDASPQMPPRRWLVSEPLRREVGRLAVTVERCGFAGAGAAHGAAALLLTEAEVPGPDQLPVEIRQALRESVERLQNGQGAEVALEMTTERYRWLGEVVRECLQRAPQTGASLTDRLDGVLTHRVWGMVVFIAAMAAMFSGIFLVADPLVGVIEWLVTSAQDVVTRLLPPGDFRDLLKDGVIAGAGNVVAFFPQICVLFLFIALLEDTGYMARAAFLMDRLMSRVGLHGKSFIPLLSCHACAIPGIMATRVIENPKDRLATILVAPLISCSARLPVYTVLIAACLPGSPLLKAGVLLSMYLLGIVAALAMASLFKRTLLRGPTPAFLIELPPYRMPRPLSVLFVMWDRSRLFLTRAGTTILAMTILLWAMMTYPRSAERAQRYEAERQAVSADAPDAAERLAAIDTAESSDNLRHSAAGRLGRLIEPVIRPLGYDWRIGIGLVSSFAAREVFVGTIGIVLNVGDAEAESSSLSQRMASATWPDGRRLFTPAVAVGLMVFYVLACQCVSTIIVVRKETNSLAWPAFMFGYMSLLAYLGALAVYQGARLLGWGVA